jgi:hypothetical protein
MKKTTLAVTLLVAGIWQAWAAAAPKRIQAFCIDFNWGEGGPNGFAPPGLWADADPAEHVAWYSGLGANVTQTFAVSCNGYAWYKNGKVVPPQPGLRRDFLPEMVKLGHARGMKVMGYFCIAANTRWGRLNPSLSYGTPSDYHIPLTKAYLDFLGNEITEALRISHMDGFMIDWVWNPKRPQDKWLDCEKQAFREVMGRDFPGEDKLAKDDWLAYERRAIDRCWRKIHDTAKKVRRDCVIWLSCNNLLDPTVANSTMFREVDWLMNEAGDLKSLGQVRAMTGAHTQLVTCLVGWGDAHNARAVLSDPQSAGLAIYGFVKPRADSLPLPIRDYLGKRIDDFQGNDRNIATFVRFFNKLPFDTVK